MAKDWSTLVLEVSTSVNSSGATECIVAINIKSVGGEEAYNSFQQVIDNLYDVDPSKNRLNQRALADSLLKRGVPVKKTSLFRHVSKQCSCFYNKDKV